MSLQLTSDLLSFGSRSLLVRSSFVSRSSLVAYSLVYRRPNEDRTRNKQKTNERATNVERDTNEKLSKTRRETIGVFATSDWRSLQWRATYPVFNCWWRTTGSCATRCRRWHADAVFHSWRTATIVSLRDSFSVSKIDFYSVRRLFISHVGCLSSQPPLISFLSEDTLIGASIRSNPHSLTSNKRTTRPQMTWRSHEDLISLFKKL